MADYYVDFTGGDDTNTGLSEGQAWKNVTKVDTEFNAGTFNAGDNIFLKRGETWPGQRIRIRNCSGTLGNHIYIGAYGSGDRPCIDQNGGSSPCIDHDSSWADANYITIEDLELTGSDNSICVRMEAVHHWTLSNLYVHDVTTSFSPGIRIRDASHHIIVDGCTIDTIDSEAIYIGVGDDDTSNDRIITIKNCTIGPDTEREGLDLKDATRHVFIHDCTFDTCGGSEAGMQVSVGGKWNIFYQCRFTGTNAGNSHGIRLGCYAGAPVTDSGNNCVMERCLFEDQTGTYGAIELSLHSNRVSNCTFYNCKYGIYFDSGDATGNHIVKNNIFEQITDYPVYIDAGEDHTEVDFDNNDYGDGSADVWYQNGAARTFAFVQGLGQEASGITDDPDFAETTNYTLNAGSNCINAGDSSVTVYDYNDEYDGTDVDMGWREYGWTLPHRTFQSTIEDTDFPRFTGYTGVTADSSVVYTGSYSLRANITDATDRYAYVTGLGDLGHFYADFEVNADDLTMASGDLFNIWEGRTSGNSTYVVVQLYYDGSDTQVRCGVQDDTPAWTYSSYFDLASGWNHIQIFWLASHMAGEDEGELALWLNGTAVAELGSKDNHDNLIDRFYVGAVDGLDAGTSGDLYIDAIRMDWVRYMDEMDYDPTEPEPPPAGGAAGSPSGGFMVVGPPAPARHEVYLTTDTGLRLSGSGNPLAKFLALRASRVANGIGWIDIAVPTSFDLMSLFKRDFMVQVWRAPKGGTLALWRPYFLRKYRVETVRGQKSYVLSGPCVNEVLRRRPVVAFSGSSQADKADYADDMMKEIVTEAQSDSVEPTPDAGSRAWSLLSVAADLSAGPTITKSMALKGPLLSLNGGGVLPEIAHASRVAGTDLFFDVVTSSVSSTSINFEFRTYTGQRGQDLSDFIVFDEERGNMEGGYYEYDASEEITYVYGAGQGQGQARNIQQVYDADRYNASVWNRIEAVADARNVTADNAVREKARDLLKAGEPIERAGGTLLDTAEMRYGIHWHFGDKIKARYEGKEFISMVHTIELLVDPKVGERVTARWDYVSNV